MNQKPFSPQQPLPDAMPLEHTLVELLIRKGYHIVCAESCTGGLLASTLINVPNASRVLDISLVTYANEAKINCLGVRPSTIEAFGVVSEPVAGEMAAGAAGTYHAEIGISTSGIAGPSGGTAQKPVGMVCFGFSICGRLETRTRYFGNPGRSQVRQESVHYALQTLLELLQSSDSASSPLIISRPSDVR